MKKKVHKRQRRTGRSRSVLMTKRISGFILLSFIFFVFGYLLFQGTTSSPRGALSLNKSYAQEVPDGENIAPNTQTLFSQDIISTTPGIPFYSNAVVWHGPRNEKKVALTFDADMTPGMKVGLMSGRVKSSFDTRIIDILEQTQTKATFFLTGMWIEQYRSQVIDLSHNELFSFGNHSYSHPSFDGNCYGLRQVPDSEDIPEVDKTQALLKEITGRDNHLFRFPGGCYSQLDVDIITRQTGLEIVHWDVVGNDGFNPNVLQIEHNVIDHVQNGSIIVLHLNGYPNAPKTASALPAIIQAIKDRGYEFVTVDELLHMPKK